MKSMKTRTHKVRVKRTQLPIQVSISRRSEMISAITGIKFSGELFSNWSCREGSPLNAPGLVAEMGKGGATSRITIALSKNVSVMIDMWDGGKKIDAHLVET